MTLAVLLVVKLTWKVDCQYLPHEEIQMQLCKNQAASIHDHKLLLL